MQKTTPYFIQQCKKKNIDPSEIKEFADTFIQPLPSYGIDLAFGWKQFEKGYNYSKVFSHLTGKISMGSFGKWYPKYAICDMDSTSLSRAKEIRKANGFDKKNSILAESKSKDSYHLLTKPVYSGKPMTISLFQTLSYYIEQDYNIEVYPKSNHLVRLPFGKHFKPIDLKYRKHMGIKLLEDFNNLQEWDMFGRFPFKQNNVEKRLFSADQAVNVNKSWYKQGQELFLDGLQEYSSRYESQAKVIYYLMRCNHSESSTYEIVKKWIKTKHHGYSESIEKGKLNRVYSEIKRQVRWFYENYEFESYLPDQTQKTHTGYISKEQMVQVVKICGGNVPMMKFLNGLLQFCNARQKMPWINIHKDYLVKWSSNETYLKQIKDLESKKILIRNEKYYSGIFSKSVTILDKDLYDTIDNAILLDNRSPEDLKSVIHTGFTGKEYNELLKTTGISRQNINNQCKRFFDKTIQKK